MQMITRFRVQDINDYVIWQLNTCFFSKDEVIVRPFLKKLVEN